MQKVRISGRIIFFAGILATFAACGGSSTESQVSALSTGNCGSVDLCLGLKVVSYSDGGVPVLDLPAVQSMLAGVNQIWARCGIGFRLEDYSAIEPKNLGLSDSTESMSELPQIRSALQTENQILVVLTEKWGASGNINDSGADAWTTLPGNPPYGAIIDRPVAGNSNIVAHEIGHYLSLLHVSDRSNLLSPVVGSSSRNLDPTQCSRARASAEGVWSSMLRS